MRTLRIWIDYGTIVICHRGNSSAAPENTLEAYAGAMDYGADGCEFDLRRTRDGFFGKISYLVRF